MNLEATNQYPKREISCLPVVGLPMIPPPVGPAPHATFAPVPRDFPVAETTNPADPPPPMHPPPPPTTDPPVKSDIERLASIRPPCKVMHIVTIDKEPAPASEQAPAASAAAAAATPAAEAPAAEAPNLPPRRNLKLLTTLNLEERTRPAHWDPAIDYTAKPPLPLIPPPRSRLGLS